MVLSDRDIREWLDAEQLRIDPLADRAVQPASVDVRLSSHFLVFRNMRDSFIDIRRDQSELYEHIEVDEDRPFLLHPGEFVLGSTVERITLPRELVARLEGKSSLGRLGLVVHATAGYVDPGWDGCLTLELSNLATLPIALYPDMKIGQISFLRLASPVDCPYGSEDLGSKYRGDLGPAASRAHMDYGGGDAQRGAS